MKKLLLLASISLLAACSQPTPLQKALASNPNQFAQEVDENIARVGESMVRMPNADCIKYALNHNYATTIINEENKDTYITGSLQQVKRDCGSFYADLASSMNTNSHFQGLVESDFENKLLWQHYLKAKHHQYQGV